MLRPLRAGDIPEYAELYREYFPEEANLLLADSGAFQKVVARAFHWDARLIFGFLRLIGRPIGHFFAVEADGRLAGVTFLLFDGDVGYIASVAVDAPYRRRGFARQLMAAAEAAAVRRGSKYTVLDVIETNVPAIQLYRSLGYQSLRRVGWYDRDVGPGNPPLPRAPVGDRARPLRPFRKSEGDALAAIALARQPALERAVRPVRPSAFSVPPLLTRILGGSTEAFVRAGPQGVEGFVRSSSSGSMGSGNLVAPMGAPDVPEAAVMDLMDQGLSWFHAHPVRRIICEVPEDDRATLNRLAARGFQRGLGLETLAKPLYPGPPNPLAVYLLPAVVGGGRGDIEDLRAVGEVLRPTGIPLYLPVGTLGAPRLPPGEIERWTFVRPEGRLRRRAVRALTVVPQFGICAAPARPGPDGRAGPWAPVVEALEGSYGPDRVVHLSLEEFARNLSAAEQETERLREGGVPMRRIRALQKTSGWRRDVARMRRLWRRYHELDRANLLSLVPTFTASAACRRDFPELLECGPVPPPEGPSGAPLPAARSVPGDPRWVWYASPSTSPLLLPGLSEGSRRSGRPLALALRTPRPIPRDPIPPGLDLEWVGDEPRSAWERRFRDADVRIVTGSRSLLEALDLGRPFLYFHGAMGTGRRRRAHRPEKIRGLLRLWGRAGVPRELRRDLADFARGRRVGAIVEQALTDPDWGRRFPPRPILPHLPAGRTDGGAVIRSIAEGWARSSRSAGAFVRAWRAGGGE